MTPVWLYEILMRSLCISEQGSTCFNAVLRGHHSNTFSILLGRFFYAVVRVFLAARITPFAPTQGPFKLLSAALCA